MSKKYKVKSPFEIESLQEFIARGGTIKRMPPAVQEPQLDVTRTTPQSGGVASFLSLEEADLFFGEPSKRQPKKGKQSSSATTKIDLNVLPPALRAKFISKLKEGIDGEGYEEDLEELEIDSDN